MFRKLVSGLPFSPALVGTLGFYARRLKKEEATRRLGLIFTALALIMQSFAVFAPPEHANAANSNDMIYGGITTREQILKAYDEDARFRSVITYAGISRDELAKTQLKTINNLSHGTGDDAWKSWGYNSRFSSEQGEVKHSAFGATAYSRPNYLYNTGLSTKKTGANIEVYYGNSARLGEFGIMLVSGSLIAPKLPTPVPPAPTPAVACKSVEAIKAGDGRYRFRASSLITNDAQLNGYVIRITDSAGKTVKTISQPSNETSYETDSTYAFTPGKYTVSASVITPAGSSASHSCVQPFEVASSQSPIQPSLRVEKAINGHEQQVVAVNESFDYNITVENTGDVPLTQVSLVDVAPDGVSLTGASAGAASDNTWKHTVALLNVGAKANFTVKAVAKNYTASLLKNTVCADSPTITTGSPDDCDDAVVILASPQITVCQLATLKTITITEANFDETVYSKDLADCQRIQVCDLSSNTAITITEKDFESSRYSRDLSQCENIQICDLLSAEVKTIKQEQFDGNTGSVEIYDCQSAVIRLKTVKNLTQDQIDATQRIAQSGDRILFRLSAENTGKITSTVNFSDNITDTLEYSTLYDNGGGALTETERGEKILSWGNIVLRPGDAVSRTFTVKVVDDISSAPRGLSDPTSYDCVMTNTFGSTTNIPVNCSMTKTLESAISQLPSAGPGANLLFAGAIGLTVVFFYARSRQLSSEVKLVRRDFNAGVL